MYAAFLYKHLYNVIRFVHMHFVYDRRRDCDLKERTGHSLHSGIKNCKGLFT